MIPLPDQLTVLNLLFCIVIMLISLHGFRKIGNVTPLFIGVGFFAFAISHLLTLMNLASSFQIPLAIIRTTGYSFIVVGVSLILREVIRRYSAEYALKQSNEELEQRVIDRTREIQQKNKEQVMLLDTMDAQVWYLIDSETYGAVNQAHADFFGVKPEDIEYHPIKEYLRDDVLEFCLNGNREVFSKGTHVKVERWITDKTGEAHLLEISKTPKISETGVVEFVVCVAVDITERKRKEERLVLANRKLNMLSSVTRHDILNDIQFLYAYLDLSRKYITDSKLAEYHTKEIEAVEAIQHQIEFTRFYQDIGVQSPAWQDIDTVIRTAAEKIPGLPVPVDIRFSGYRIFADPLFEKAIYNLIENALRHGEHVTRITFSLEIHAQNSILICSDDGIGISDAEKSKIFEKGHGKNTGFGLFLIREILSITQITITETGTAGVGAEFRIKIPRWAFSKTS